ncbi:MAG: glutamate 5-kinase [Vulcanococcus sp.]|jgi:glutamate 5-kinase|uniref:glutamate 5-kinase n=1 Tax=Vulcanococcus sp. TaxID=2856995 RepID=UPI0025EB2481|nr:glutamate 5-kinase [Vulcanococcus sp.]MBW0174632.1 glutamate 5-kinase [Vulcanococcus sp.]MBW0181430.1 glutamate 5-kinase [Vulcanococcus sp.]
MTMRRVVKVGTSVLRGAGGRNTEEVIADLAASLCRLWKRGEPVVLVTSGAVGLGCTALGHGERPTELEGLQAAAAVGQGRLMTLYDQAFARHQRCVAQVLLTRGDLASRRRYQNACRTLEQLLAWGVTPVINENDTLATDELRFGDNDTLSALVAVAVQADELVLLTDIDSLYSGDPRSDADARPIPEVNNLEELEALSGVAKGGGRWGTGGMTTKLSAARIATASGIQVRLADGRDPAVLNAVLAGEPRGTLFRPSETPLSDRKGWLAHALLPKGSITIDAGAERALLDQGASLLAVGVREVEGDFNRRDAVRLLSLDGRELARGLTAMDSDELQERKGQRGLVVHRDQLVITPGANRS